MDQCRQALCLSSRYNLVGFSPDYLNRDRETGQAWHQVQRLMPIFEYCSGYCLQRFHSTIEALVADNVIEHFAADQCWIREQLFDERTKLPRPVGPHETIDILHI